MTSLSPDSSTSHPAQQPIPVMYLPAPVATSAPDEVNLLEVWKILTRSKWLILFFTLLSTAIAVAIALNSTRFYRSELLLEAVSTDGKQGSGLAQLGGLAAMAGINLGGKGNSKDSMIAKLQSRIFLTEFIQDEQLMPILFDKKWDKVAKKWQVTEKKEIPTLLQGVEYFQSEILKINQETKTGLITLSIEWKDPIQASQWANLLVTRINRHLRTIAIQEANKNIDYLNIQLAKAQIVEIKQVIASLLEDQIKQIMLTNRSDEFAFKVIDPAVIPEKPFKPKRKVMVILGFIIGLFLGIMIALLRSLIRRAKQTTSQSAATNPK